MKIVTNHWKKKTKLINVVEMKALSITYISYSLHLIVFDKKLSKNFEHQRRKIPSNFSNNI